MSIENDMREINWHLECAGFDLKTAILYNDDVTGVDVDEAEHYAEFYIDMYADSLNKAIEFIFK